MNINQSISKLLNALSQKGQVYRINSFKFYIEDKGKYSTKYMIFKKEKVEIYNTKTDKYEIVEKYKQKETYYNKIGVLKYLAKELQGE